MATQEIPLVEGQPEIANQPAPTARRWMVAALLAVLVLFAAGALSLRARAKEQTALSAETARLAVTTISAGYPQPEPRSNELELPGSVQAYTESPIYARTNGYLLRWSKDIGASVQKGELLADLDTPEVDQELSQAQAARQQMVAALDLARTSADRWRELRRTDSVSQQELDQKTSDYAQAQANMLGVVSYINANGKFPGSADALMWYDMSGQPHVFSTTAEFMALYSAGLDFVMDCQLVADAGTGTLPAATATIP